MVSGLECNVPFFLMVVQAQVVSAPLHMLMPQSRALRDVNHTLLSDSQRYVIDACRGSTECAEECISHSSYGIWGKSPRGSQAEYQSVISPSIITKKTRHGLP